MLIENGKKAGIIPTAVQVSGKALANLQIESLCKNLNITTIFLDLALTKDEATELKRFYGGKSPAISRGAFISLSLCHRVQKEKINSNIVIIIDKEHAALVKYLTEEIGAQYVIKRSTLNTIFLHYHLDMLLTVSSQE